MSWDFQGNDGFVSYRLCFLCVASQLYYCFKGDRVAVMSGSRLDYTVLTSILQIFRPADLPADSNAGCMTDDRRMAGPVAATAASDDTNAATNSVNCSGNSVSAAGLLFGVMTLSPENRTERRGNERQISYAHRPNVSCGWHDWLYPVAPNPMFRSGLTTFFKTAWLIFCRPRCTFF